MYPLGPLVPLPPEILSNIVKVSNSPSLFRNLSLVSRRVRNAIQPSLETIGLSPISLKEIINYINTLPELRNGRYTYITLIKNDQTPVFVSLFVSFPLDLRSSGSYVALYRGGTFISNWENLNQISPKLYQELRTNKYLPGAVTLTKLWDVGFRSLGSINDLRSIYTRRISCVKIVPNYLTISMNREVKNLNKIKDIYIKLFDEFFQKECLGETVNTDD